MEPIMSAAPASTAEHFGQYIARFLNNEPVADLYGVNDAHFARYEQQAYQLYRQSRLDDAEVIVNGIIALDATRPYPYMLRGDIALRHFRLDDAIEAFTQAKSLETDDRRSGAAVKLGEALLKARRGDEALVELEEVIATTRESHHHHRRALSLKRVLEAFQG